MPILNQILKCAEIDKMVLVTNEDLRDEKVLKERIRGDFQG